VECVVLNALLKQMRLCRPVFNVYGASETYFAPSAIGFSIVFGEADPPQL
jgi:hypothetical protein